MPILAVVELRTGERWRGWACSLGYFNSCTKNLLVCVSYLELPLKKAATVARAAL